LTTRSTDISGYDHNFAEASATEYTAEMSSLPNLSPWTAYQSSVASAAETRIVGSGTVPGVADALRVYRDAAAGDLRADEFADSLVDQALANTYATDDQTWDTDRASDLTTWQGQR
jgi:hypothetical protein